MNHKSFLYVDMVLSLMCRTTLVSEVFDHESVEFMIDICGIWESGLGFMYIN